MRGRVYRPRASCRNSFSPFFKNKAIRLKFATHCKPGDTEGYSGGSFTGGTCGVCHKVRWLGAIGFGWMQLAKQYEPEQECCGTRWSGEHSIGGLLRLLRAFAAVHCIGFVLAMTSHKFAPRSGPATGLLAQALSDLG